MGAERHFQNARWVHYKNIPIDFMDADPVDIAVPVDEETRFFPTAVIIDNQEILGTLATAAVIEIDDGTNGELYAAAVTLTAPVENRHFIVPPYLPAAGQPYTIVNGRKLRIRKTTLAAGQATTFRERTDNVATLTTALAHGFVVGDIINVRLVGAAAYNGIVTVTSVPTTTTFTYDNIGPDEASTADTAGRVGAYRAKVHVLGLYF